MGERTAKSIEAAAEMASESADRPEDACAQEKRAQQDGELLIRSMLEAANEVPAASAALASGAPLLAEVLDTHHPHLPGRVAVAWLDPDGTPRQRWVASARSLRVRRGDRVLMVKPANFSSFVVTTVIAGAAGEDAPAAAVAPSAREADGAADRTLALERGEVLRITSIDGQPLVTVEHDEQGPVVRLLEPDADIELSGRLRVRAEAIELEAREGGIDLRSQGDAVVRARTIRLN